MMPLITAGQGTQVIVENVDAGQKLKKRLADLGLHKGSVITVVKNESHGPLVLSVKDSKLAVGRGQASKILVESK